ncbi:MAG: hypothetical protein WCG42_03310 [Parachlamydiaceae bacterium]
MSLKIPSPLNFHRWSRGGCIFDSFFPNKYVQKEVPKWKLVSLPGLYGLEPSFQESVQKVQAALERVKKDFPQWDALLWSYVPEHEGFAVSSFDPNRRLEVTELECMIDQYRSLDSGFRCLTTNCYGYEVWVPRVFKEGSAITILFENYCDYRSEYPLSPDISFEMLNKIKKRATEALDLEKFDRQAELLKVVEVVGYKISEIDRVYKCIDTDVHYRQELKEFMEEMDSLITNPFP